MLRFLVLVAVVVGGMAQRPMYAGSRPIGAPELGSRFRDQEGTSTAAPDLGQRFGEGDANANLPVDALGDEYLVNRLNQWPREHRPFWLINAEAIEAHRNRNVNAPQGQSQGQDLNTRGNFNQDNQEVSSLPIRPTHHRPSFLGAAN